MEGNKIKLRDVYKGYTYDLDKLISPKETIKRFKEKTKEVGLDILDETVRIDNGRLGIPVYFSICGSEARRLIGTRKQMGKGGTPEQAEASAIMELTERFSLYSFLRRHFKELSYREVKEKAIPFEYIARSVHDESDGLKLYDIFSEIPMRWCYAYNMSKDKELLIPIDWFFMINQYNGSSAGNCNEEAILQGICEVVERHVSAVVSEDRISVPSVDVSHVEDPLAKELLGKYRKTGINLYINDFSLDMGIPTISVVAHDPSTFPELSEIVWTAGTTTSPEKSLIRALTEVAQLAGDFNTGANYVASGLPKPKNLDEIDYILKVPSKVSIQDLPDLSDPNIKVEIEKTIASLSKKDMDIVVVNITHPRLNIPAFYIIIPGARFRERAKGSTLGMFTARLVFEKGDPSYTLDVLERMNERIPNRYYVEFYRGLCYMYLGNIDKAITHLKKSLSLNPETQDIPTIYSYLGHCLKECERYVDAIEVLKKAEEYDDTRIDIYNLMGFCYFKLRDHKKAISSFEKAISIDPGSAIDYANIGVNYEKMGKIDEAIRYYKIALELDPDISFAKKNLSRLSPSRQTSSHPS